MGFFQDLKEDLSQAVTELMDDDTTQKTAQEKTAQVDEMMPVEQLPEDATEEVTEDSVEETLDEEVKEALDEDILEEDSKTEALAEAPEEVEETVNAVVMDHESEALMKDMLKEMEVIKEKHAKVEKTMPEEYTDEEIDETAVVTQGMIIKGDVSSKGSMEVIGSIEGNIDLLGKLNVTGAIKGNSKAAEIFADAAKIVGEVNAKRTVKIGASSVIIGNIQATSAVIAGAVKGDIDVQGPVVLDTSAIVMGNIKSKSVQINNGAVIEGMCSQCYADVNPINFFDEFK
ncbi:MAG: polymer-forming cytoskeletal protein [Lachnospiraceae bacterium]|nr:polymer-forming cytoskeletal protein [Lachnospiraceae bacterium]